MAIAMQPSSVSLAIKGVAEYLSAHMSGAVHVVVDTPSNAAKKAEASETMHVLNLFVYRVAPSGVHAATASNEPFYIRVNALLTPFLGKDAEADDDGELRVIGHAIRVLQSQPEIPTILPPSGKLLLADGKNPIPDVDLTRYRLQAVLQAPSMEELNHIWTTQNSELAYRLSAAYEFALIPIEPLASLPIPGPPVRTAIRDVRATMADKDTRPAPFGPDTGERPLAGKTEADPPPTDWLPLVLFAEGGVLANAVSIAKNSPQVGFALAGPPGESVAAEVIWTKTDGSTVSQLPIQIIAIKTPRIDSPLATQTKLTLQNPWPGETALVRVVPAAGGNPVPNSPYANTLTLRAP